MKNFLYSVLLIALVSLAGCGGEEESKSAQSDSVKNDSAPSDPVQEELLKYINEDLKAIESLERKAIDAYDSVSGENYQNDAVMYEKIKNEVIPTYQKFINKLEEIEIDSDELAKVHETYINASNTQYNAFVKILDALEKQDQGAVSEANQMLSEARSGIRDFQRGIKKLAEEHNVTIQEAGNENN